MRAAGRGIAQHPQHLWSGVVDAPTQALLAPADGEALCTRPCESAFFSSDLERALRMRGAGSLIVCGAPSSGAMGPAAA